LMLVGVWLRVRGRAECPLVARDVGTQQQQQQRRRRQRRGI
jgi:hypothetical protein